MMNKILSVVYQILLFIVITLLPLVGFLAPVYLLRKLKIDSKEDYVNFGDESSDSLSQRLSSMSDNIFNEDKNEDDEGIILNNF